jgi:hypothetical protein
MSDGESQVANNQQQPKYQLADQLPKELMDLFWEWDWLHYPGHPVISLSQRFSLRGFPGADPTTLTRLSPPINLKV